MADRRAPTLLNLPSPGMGTPSDAGPGTPGSTATSISALSTTAIKDGHVGSNPHVNPNQPTTSTLAAERADRISRLSGMNDLSAARSPGAQVGAQANSYFDGTNQSPTAHKSTIGSASASSVPGAASTVTDAEPDELASVGASETTAMSNDTTETGSIVAFGEAAGDTLEKADDDASRLALQKQALLRRQREESERQYEAQDVPMDDA